MTVAELITELVKWDQWLPVTFSDSEVGPRPVETVAYATWTDDEGIVRRGIAIGAPY